MVLPGDFQRDDDGFALPAAYGGTLACKIAKVEYTDTSAKTLFSLPAGAIPIWWVIDIVTDFDAGTNNLLDVGYAADGDYFVNDMDIGTVGVFAPTTSGAVNGSLGVQLSVDGTNDITATYAPTGTAATQGEANVIVFYMQDNEDYTIQ
ncbi:MAG: hypothetical protein GTO60_16745 [Gammaproteobacteria bacterium]|nr:hypothetical protein [Gammaproteobacteria bacterium]